MYLYKFKLKGTEVFDKHTTTISAGTRNRADEILEELSDIVPEVDHVADFYHHDRFGNKLSIGDRVKVTIPKNYFDILHTSPHPLVSFGEYTAKEGIVEGVPEGTTLIKLEVDSSRSEVCSIPFNLMEKIELMEKTTRK
ncbi:MAG: hypothetical protein WBB28_02055 [Crinalium sp.]